MSDTTRFDQQAAAWDQDDVRVLMGRAIAQTIVDVVKPCPHWDLLDFGAGTGLVGLTLRPHVGTLTAADTSAGMLGVLEGKAAALGLAGVSTQLLTAGDGFAIRGQYDLIVSSMALHHVPEPARVFRQFANALKPGGRVALADLDREDGTFHSPDITDVFHQGFDRQVFRTMLADAGFEGFSDTTAFVRQRHGREYPVFLITGHLSNPT